MITTRVFAETIKAYNKGYSIIASRGGTRSSKTFSELQLFKIISEHSKIKRIITVVSFSLPHLEGSAIRDFEKILEIEGIPPESVRTKHPYIYRIKKSIVEFIGFDRPGKALGASRHILLIIEANKLPYNICNQLMIRTTECVFMDWNPSEDFWFDKERYEDREDCKLIESNFFDNIYNLSEKQLRDFAEAKRKAEEEERKGIHGYWWNWWRVYGLGLKGVLEGTIFHNWTKYKTLPDDIDFYRMLVIDWGGADPTTLTQLNFDGDNDRLFVKKIIYQPQILNSKLIEVILENIEDEEIIVYDSARKDKGYELRMAEIRAMPCKKYPGVKLDNIDSMQEFMIFIHEDSKEIIEEFQKYKRIKDEKTNKFLDQPEDDNDHAIDAIGYGVEFYRRLIRPLKKQ